MSELDLLSGLVNLDENDPKTAFFYCYHFFSFSYFFESFENTVSLNQPILLARLLKYMLFSKILYGDISGIIPLTTMKQFLPYRENQHVRSIIEVAEAYKDRSLEKFHQVKEKYPVGITLFLNCFKNYFKMKLLLIDWKNYIFLFLNKYFILSLYNFRILRNFLHLILVLKSVILLNY